MLFGIGIDLKFDDLFDGMILLDWYDGPTEGVCIKGDTSIKFEMVERTIDNYHFGLIDHAVYALRILPSGTFDLILALNPPKDLHWDFSNQADLQMLAAIDSLLAVASAPQYIVIETSDDHIVTMVMKVDGTLDAFGIEWLRNVGYVHADVEVFKAPI